MIATSDGVVSPVMAEKDEERLPLVGEQIDLPQRLGDPDDAGQRRQARQKRVSGGAENVSFDSQHPTIEFRWPTGESRRSAVRSAALARRAPSGKARGPLRGERPCAALLTAARNPTMKAAARPPSREEQHVRIRQDRLWRARRPQGRNLRHLRRRGSQAVAAGGGADRRGGRRASNRRPRRSASAARPRPRWTSSKRRGSTACGSLVVGVAPGKDGKPIDFVNLGGFVFGKLGAAKKVAVAFVAPEGEWDAGSAAEFALGLRLRAYRFDKYKTKKDNGDEADDAAPAVTIESDVRRRRARRRRAADGGRRGRRTRPHPRQRAAQRALSRILRRARGGAEGARRRSRDSRREGDEQARHGRAARRRPGLEARQPPRRHALARRPSAQGQAGRLRRQGRLLRFRRHFDQARRRHGGHEGRHGRRGLRRRADARARRAQGQGRRGRRDRPGREHAGRRRHPAGRHLDLDVRPDDRDHQHRRGGAAGARRRAELRAREVQAALHDRSRDADRRDHRRARPGARRAVLQRRRACRAPQRRRRRRPARRSGACRSGRPTTS